ncbi:MAG: biotin/lipoyl-binding protein [Gammaproteobacteria bacterium]
MQAVTSETSWTRSVVILISLVAVCGFLVWAHWAEIDQISRAPGRVIPSGRVQIVQAADEGVITEILVREGDRVERGELLVKLDVVRAQAALDESRGKEAALRAAKARIEAELYDRPLKFDPSLAEYPEFVENQKALYEKRRRAFTRRSRRSSGSIRSSVKSCA